MSDQNFSAIRARLRYETIEDFVDGYARFISAGGMFIPMKPGKLKPIGTTIRFQFLLGDGSTALLGEGIVLQVRAPDDASPQSPVGMLIKFSKLAQESKALVDRIVEEKSGQSQASEDVQEDIHNDRTPLPQDKESYERKTRESFDSQATKQALAAEAAEPEPADPHSKITDSGTDRGAWEETTREQKLVPAEQVLEEASAGVLEEDGAENRFPMNDVFGSDEEANDAVVAAALAMASEVSEQEAALEEPSELSDADDSISLEEIDPETAEAPAEPETREAPEMIEELVEEATPKSPTQLGETTGGLKILAFEEDMDEAAIRALEEFSFGAEEADIDDMFDGLFGDGLGGGFLGADRDPEPQPSIEFEVPGLTQEVSEDLVEEEVLVAAEEPIEEAPPEEKPVFSLEDLMDDEDDFKLEQADESDESDEIPLVDEFPSADAVEEEADVFSLVDEAEDDQADDEPAFSLSDLVEESEPAVLEHEAPAPVLEEESSEAVLSFDDVLEESEPEEDLTLGDPASEPQVSHGHEDIGSLLDSLDDESHMSPESLHLGTSPRDEPEMEQESSDDDEESLEALLASARREIEERSTEEPRDNGDILDQLLGGDDLPPPPAEGPVFGMPKPEKKKKGFLSKFFDKD